MSVRLAFPKLAYAMFAFASMFRAGNIVLGRALHADSPIKVQAEIGGKARRRGRECALNSLSGGQLLVTRADDKTRKAGGGGRQERTRLSGNSLINPYLQGKIARKQGNLAWAFDISTHFQ